MSTASCPAPSCSRAAMLHIAFVLPFFRVVFDLQAIQRTRDESESPQSIAQRHSPLPGKLRRGTGIPANETGGRRIRREDTEGLLDGDAERVVVGAAVNETLNKAGDTTSRVREADAEPVGVRDDDTVWATRGVDEPVGVRDNENDWATRGGDTVQVALNEGVTVCVSTSTDPRLASPSEDTPSTTSSLSAPAQREALNNGRYFFHSPCPFDTGLQGLSFPFQWLEKERYGAACACTKSHHRAGDLSLKTHMILQPRGGTSSNSSSRDSQFQPCERNCTALRTTL